MTAVDAAKILGVSRKTYYKWEKRGLSGLVNALDARLNGRPETSQEELEKQGLQDEISRLKEQNALLQKQLCLKDKVHQLELDIQKKDSSGKDTCNKKK